MTRHAYDDVIATLSPRMVTALRAAAIDGGYELSLDRISMQARDALRRRGLARDVGWGLTRDGRQIALILLKRQDNQ